MDEFTARKIEKQTATYPAWIQPVISELLKRGMSPATATLADLERIRAEMAAEVDCLTRTQPDG